jgi:hypothetical protein
MILSEQSVFYLLGGLILAWNIVLTLLFWRITSHYQRLAGKTKKGNLQMVLDTLLKEAEKSKFNLKTLEKEISKVDKRLEKDYQKSALVKYNPFEDAGGNQSFSLVILNGVGDGLMITSLHGRESTRVYSKLIVDGKPESGNLSKEEQLAVKNALGG